MAAPQAPRESGAGLPPHMPASLFPQQQPSASPLRSHSTDEVTKVPKVARLLRSRPALRSVWLRFMFLRTTYTD